MNDGITPARPASYDKKVGLVLQGGGALGSYQGGVYETLAVSEYLPDWVAGISIGAINAAVIAGNAPEHRVRRLRSFWEEITAHQSVAFSGRRTNSRMATVGRRTLGADVWSTRFF
jgi:predicted acylesterase/phospholipase RssA